MNRKGTWAVLGIAVLAACGAHDGGRDSCGCDVDVCGCVNDETGECAHDGSCHYMNRCDDGTWVDTCGNGVCDCGEGPADYFYYYGSCPQDCGCEPGSCELGPVEACSRTGQCCASDGECEVGLGLCQSGEWTSTPECP
jgi:hypothetical protein